LEENQLNTHAAKLHRQIVEEHPDSPYGNQAKTRLTELEKSVRYFAGVFGTARSLMKTTRGLIEPVEYLGIDLSDRYAKNRRPNDVCGLTSVECDKLSATFWLWEWSEPERRLDVSEIVKEMRTAKATMIDGPQALASTGNTLLACERACGAAGKTPDVLPTLGKPFAGFVRSSVELFSAFAALNLIVSPSQFMDGISEVYPGDIWHRLVGPTIPKKSTYEGRLARKLILQALGIIGLPDLPTHDQNDACISAAMAAASHGKVRGMCVRGIGSPLSREPDGTLREGPIVIPLLSQQLRESLDQALRDLQFHGELQNPPIARKTNFPKIPAVVGDSLLEKALTLCDYFVRMAKECDAQICTYAWAYRHLFNESPAKWSQAYARQVITLAVNTPLIELPTLGKVGLDSFIVSSRTGLPGEEHWKRSAYDREDWERVLGTAMLLR
jgi:hypothetical protein